MAKKALAVVQLKPTKLDIGCGTRKKEGFYGVDSIQLPGVDLVFDVRKTPWPFESESIEEVYCSHFLEHLTNLDGKWERVKFFNELWRVMKVDAKCLLQIPHWCSIRFYGDPTHKEPFSEFGFYYLSRKWRATEAPHADSKFNKDGYSCEFECTWGWGLHPTLSVRNQEYQIFALNNYKDAATDLIATMVKKA